MNVAFLGIDVVKVNNVFVVQRKVHFDLRRQLWSDRFFVNWLLSVDRTRTLICHQIDEGKSTDSDWPYSVEEKLFKFNFWLFLLLGFVCPFKYVFVALRVSDETLWTSRSLVDWNILLHYFICFFRYIC
jgi:hypothetical protein